MEQFNLDKWLQDKSRKVVTRDRRPARILCTDAEAKDGCCVIAAIETNGEEEGYPFFKDGRAYLSKSSIEDCSDLFFADEEEELTEFEKELVDLVSGWCDSHIETPEEYINKHSQTLLDLARKEVEKENRDGKQKPADKVEPKFKVGDWITNGRLLVGQVTSFDGEYYHYMQEGVEQPLHISNADNWHLWTIEDAKDGDVLVGNYDNCKKPWIGIFKCISKDRPTTQFDSYCFLNSSHHIFTTPSSGKFNQCKGHTIRYALPATKEQRDLLFQKMKEAGYEWDANKKELKKIEQASTWSEEDETKLITVQTLIRNTSLIGVDGIKEATIDWLKSLKDRVQPQSKQEWSAEDEANMDAVWKACGQVYGVKYQSILGDWLKSLKSKLHWKPSEEQLDVLAYAITDIKIWKERENLPILESLYNALKSL